MLHAIAMRFRHSALVPLGGTEARPMDTWILEAVLLVADRGSFTIAAQELGISQPGLSRQIQKLERSLGVPLFVRAHDGVRLTAAGQRYCAFAREVMARHHQFLHEVRDLDGEVAGELRIAASTTPAEFVVPRLVADFTTRYPQVKATVFTTDSGGVVDELLSGRSEVGFIGARLARHRLRFNPVAEDEVVLAVPAYHPFAGRREVALDELADQRVVEREGGSGTLLSVRRALAERGLTLPTYRVSMTLTTTQAIVSAVRAGYGVGFVSSLAVAEQTDGRVVGVRLAGLALHRRLYLVRRKSHALPPVVRLFADFVLANASQP
jgi:DNA-binding transcriptional LysR family regulator